MENEVKTVTLRPTPDGYRHTLRVIIEATTNEDDREWAIEELERVKNVDKWADEE